MNIMKIGMIFRILKLNIYLPAGAFENLVGVLDRESQLRGARRPPLHSEWNCISLNNFRREHQVVNEPPENQLRPSDVARGNEIGRGDDYFFPGNSVGVGQSSFPKRAELAVFFVKSDLRLPGSDIYIPARGIFPVQGRGDHADVA